MKNPAALAKVSVITPVYNGAHYLQGVFSILSQQSVRPAEWIIADDASTDNVSDVVAKLPQLEGMAIHFVRLTNNGGPSAARNAAFKRSTGDLIAFLDADDYWFPWHLETLARGRAAIGADMVYTTAEIRASPEDPPGSREYGPTPLEAATPGAYLYFRSFILPTCTLVTRSLLEKTGGFDEKFRFCEDCDLFLTAAESGHRLVHLAMRTALYNQLSIDDTKRIAGLKAFIQMLTKHRQTAIIPSHSRRLGLACYHAQLGFYLKKQQLDGAMEHFYRAWRLYWTSMPITGLLLTAIFSQGKKKDSDHPSWLDRLHRRFFRNLQDMHRRLCGRAF